MKGKMSRADLEKEQILDPERARKRKQDKRKRRAAVAAAVVLSLVLAGTAGFLVVRAMGKSSIMSKPRSQAPQMATDLNMLEKSIDWQDGWVGYQGEVYAYNEDMMTFLVMGIDKDGESMMAGNAGQADAIFLLALNPHKKQADLIAINRDTITDVEEYNALGAYVDTIKTRLAGQYTYGDGKAASARYMEKAVSNLMYQLPIHGYVAFNMDAIPSINDCVGGVEVTCLQDLTEVDPELKQGKTVLLEGESAFWYVKYRDDLVFESNRDRLSRQSQYIQAFVERAKEAFKKDMTLPVTMFQRLSGHMITDIRADEVAYLASTVASYSFEPEVHILEGETRTGEAGEEFYVNEDALYRMILDIFYEKIAEDPE